MSRLSVRDEETCRRDRNPASGCSDVGVTTQCTFCGPVSDRASGHSGEHRMERAPLSNKMPLYKRLGTSLTNAVTCGDVNSARSMESTVTAARTDNRHDNSVNLRSRRNLLASVAALALTPALTTATAASSKIRKQIVYPERSLSLNNVHTGENERVVYWADGTYQTEGLNRINWILRDFRTSETKSIDPRLLNILYLLTRTLDANKPVLVLSGYRSTIQLQ